MSLRPTKDQYFLEIAYAVRRRSTCVRKDGKGVGCVLINGLGHIVGSGYNGRPSGYEHCNHVVQVKKPADVVVHEDASDYYLVNEYPYACADAFAPPGSKPQGCEAIHAEMNALNQCYDKMWIDTCYVIRSPCVATCLKQLLQTSCRRIVFAEPSSDVDKAKEMWLRNNGRKINPMIPTTRVWDHVPVQDPFNK